MNERDYMRLYTIDGGIERLPQEFVRGTFDPAPRLRPAEPSRDPGRTYPGRHVPSRFPSRRRGASGGVRLRRGSAAEQLAAGDRVGRPDAGPGDAPTPRLLRPAGP